MADVKLRNEVADASISTPRFTFVLVSFFAVLAILLAGMGTYSVNAYTVAQRTQEFGLRVALGAKRGDLFAHGAVAERVAGRARSGNSLNT